MSHIGDSKHGYGFFPFVGALYAVVGLVVGVVVGLVVGGIKNLFETINCAEILFVRSFYSFTNIPINQRLSVGINSAVWVTF